MAALTTENPRAVTTSKIVSFPVYNNTTIYRGSFVSQQASGSVRALDPSDTAFIGVSTTQVTGGTCPIEIDETYRLTVVGIAASTAVGTVVYATTDNDFQLSSTSALKIGVVVKVVSSTEALVNTSK